MVRLTLSEAQARVAAIVAENGGRCPVVIRWEEPLATVTSTLRHAHQLLPADERTTLQVADALLAYHAHLAFEAGLAFSDAASARYLDAEGQRLKARADQTDRDGGLALCLYADEIKQGLHYAEPGTG